MIQTVRDLYLPRKMLCPDKGQTALECQMELLLQAYFHFNENYLQKVNTSLESLMRMIGLKGPAKKCRSSMKFKAFMNTLEKYIRDGYLELETGLTFEKMLKMKSNEMFTIYNRIEEPSYEKEYGSYVASEPFIKFTIEEYESLIEYNLSHNVTRDLQVYLYIKSKIWHRHSDTQTVEDNPECICLTQNQIAEKCKLSIPTVKSSLEYLTNGLKLLASKRLTISNKENGGCRQAGTNFVLRTGDWENELLHGERKSKKYFGEEI